MKINSFARGSLRRGLALALIGIRTAVLPAAGTHASTMIVTTCRADPIVNLSNGKSLALVANISTALTNVSKITYTVKIPSGVSVKSITYDQGMTAKESVTTSATNTANTYTTTYLINATTNVSVTGTATLRSSTGTTIVAGNGSGTTNKSFSITVVG